MTSPLPAVSYLVAFNNNAYDDPSLITTVAAPGVLGANNVWTDISQWVLSHDISRGRQHEFGQFEAGTLQLSLGNDNGQFSPSNTTGPFYGKLLPGRPVQVRATWAGTTYTRFTGLADSWQVVWGDPVSQDAVLHATDAFRWFQRADITSGRYAQQVVADGATDYWRLSDTVGATQAANLVNASRWGIPSRVTFGGTGAMVADPATSAQLGTNTNTYNGYLSIPPPAGTLSGASIFSVEAWVSSKNWNPASGAFNNIYTLSDNGSGALSFVIDNNGAVALLFSDDAGTSFFYETTAHLPADGSWHHVAAVYTSGLYLFIDGVYQTTLSGSGGITETAWTPLYGAIGGSGGFSQPPTAQFPGSIQDVAFYKGVVLTAAKVLTHYQRGAFPQQSSGARIGQVLNTLGWSTGARQIDTGVSTIQAQTSSLVTTSALQHMQDVENTEAGLLYMSTAGQVTFVARSTLMTSAVYQTSQATFGDQPSLGEIPFQPGVQLGVDDLDIYNNATGQRTGGVCQIVDNAASQATYGLATWQPSGTLIGTSDSEVLNRLQYVLNQYSQPVQRLGAVTLNLVDLIAPNLIGTVFGLGMGYRVTVNRHVTPDGSAFSLVGAVEHVTEHHDANSWTVQFALDPTDLTQYWVVGTSTAGQTTVASF